MNLLFGHLANILALDAPLSPDTQNPLVDNPAVPGLPEIPPPTPAIPAAPQGGGLMAVGARVRDILSGREGEVVQGPEGDFGSVVFVKFDDGKTTPMRGDQLEETAPAPAPALPPAAPVAEAPLPELPELGGGEEKPAEGEEKKGEEVKSSLKVKADGGTSFEDEDEAADEARTRAEHEGRRWCVTKTENEEEPYTIVPQREYRKKWHGTVLQTFGSLKVKASQKVKASDAGWDHEPDEDEVREAMEAEGIDFYDGYPSVDVKVSYWGGPETEKVFEEFGVPGEDDEEWGNVREDMLSQTFEGVRESWWEDANSWGTWLTDGFPEIEGLLKGNQAKVYSAGRSGGHLIFDLDLGHFITSEGDDYFLNEDLVNELKGYFDRVKSSISKEAVDGNIASQLEIDLENGQFGGKAYEWWEQNEAKKEGVPGSKENMRMLEKEGQQKLPFQSSLRVSRALIAEKVIPALKAEKEPTFTHLLKTIGTVPANWDEVCAAVKKAGIELKASEAPEGVADKLSEPEKQVMALLAGKTLKSLVVVKADKPTMPMPAEDPGMGMAWAWDAKAKRWFLTTKAENGYIKEVLRQAAIEGDPWIYENLTQEGVAAVDEAKAQGLVELVQHGDNHQVVLTEKGHQQVTAAKKDEKKEEKAEENKGPLPSIKTKRPKKPIQPFKKLDKEFEKSEVENENKVAEVKAKKVKAEVDSVKSIYNSPAFQELMTEHPLSDDEVAKDTEKAVAWILSEYEKVSGKPLDEKTKSKLHDMAFDGLT